MLTPNKFINFDRSILSKLSLILESIDEEDTTIGVLYHKLHDKFDTPNQYILSLDLLYVLEMIEIDFETKRITHAL